MKIENKAVTLVELIAVVAIVGIVASVSFATYSKSAQENRLKKAANFMRTILDAGRAYELQHPTNLPTVDSWRDNWKTYLKNYFAEQHDENGINNRILDTGGHNAIQYSIDTTGGERAIYAFDLATGIKLKLTWKGDLTRINPDALHHNPCTSDLQCDDHNACNGAEKCISGHCQSGTPLNCDIDPSYLCEYGTCNPDTGCKRLPRAHGTWCGKGSSECYFNICDGAGGCLVDQGGGCNDGDPCTSDICSGGRCVHPGICSFGTCETGYCNAGACISTGKAPPGTSCGKEGCVRQICDNTGACVNDPNDCQKC